MSSLLLDIHWKLMKICPVPTGCADNGWQYSKVAVSETR